MPCVRNSSSPGRLEQAYTIICKQAVLCYLQNPGLRSHTGFMCCKLQDCYWPGRGAGISKKVKTLQNIPIMFKLLSSWFSICLYAIKFCHFPEFWQDWSRQFLFAFDVSSGGVIGGWRCPLCHFSDITLTLFLR